MARKKKTTVEELEANVAFMAAKLEQARNEIAEDGVAIPYDNGGGQSGIRKNPAFDGYNALMSTYLKTCSQLEEMRKSAPKSSAKSTLLDMRAIAGKRAI